jgi:hypothetical protein
VAHGGLLKTKAPNQLRVPQTQVHNKTLLAPTDPRIVDNLGRFFFHVRNQNLPPPITDVLMKREKKRERTGICMGTTRISHLSPMKD